MSINGLLKTSVQLLRGGAPAIGPGKAMVLDAIERTGSISAAGRDLGMSYRRIWLLVDSLNADWREPVVATRIGGGTRRGASLTGFGRELLARYRTLEAGMVAAAGGDALDWLMAAIRSPGEDGAGGIGDGPDRQG